MGIIRRARLGDEAGIHHSHMTSIREVCVKDHGDEIKGWGYRELDDRWTNSIKSEKFRVWVVEDNNVIQGHSAFRIEQDHVVIIGLYLIPEVLGKGFGAKLMDEMFLEIRRLNIKKILLNSTYTAHNFYKKLGFKDTGDKVCREINGHGVHCFPMTLNL